MAKVALDAQKRVECMLAGIPILRLLKQLDRKMPYQQFAKEIGIMGNAEKWHHDIARQAGSVLYAIEAVDRQANNGNKR